MRLTQQGQMPPPGAPNVTVPPPESGGFTDRASVANRPVERDILESSAEQEFDRLVVANPRQALHEALSAPSDAPRAWHLLGKLVNDPSDVGEDAIFFLTYSLKTAGFENPEKVSPAATDALVECMDSLVERHPDVFRHRVARATGLADALLVESFRLVPLNWDRMTDAEIKNPIRYALLTRCLTSMNEVVTKGFFNSSMAAVIGLLCYHAESLPEKCLAYLVDTFAPSYEDAVEKGLGTKAGTSNVHKNAILKIRSINPDLFSSQRPNL